jgi:hypothetical protein
MLLVCISSELSSNIAVAFTAPSVDCIDVHVSGVARHVAPAKAVSYFPQHRASQKPVTGGKTSPANLVLFLGQSIRGACLPLLRSGSALTLMPLARCACGGPHPHVVDLMRRASSGIPARISLCGVHGAFRVAKGGGRT